MPSYQTAGAAGMDLAACLPESCSELRMMPGDIARVPCGFAIAVPMGFEAQVRPRSGLASKHGITCVNAVGTIDSDYRGEVQVPLINLGKEPFIVTQGMRIAQMVIAPIARANIVVVGTLQATERGTGGFGSTGH